VDQVASGSLSRPLTEPGNANGLADRVAAVQEARNRLGEDIDRLHEEVRVQMGHTVEKIAWKVTAIGSGVLAGVIVKKAVIAGWKAAKKQDPPANPAAPGTSWTDALPWTIATAVGAAVARLVAERGAAAGWAKATGHLPPGLEEQAA
jgi:hypothetical protein